MTSWSDLTHFAGFDWASDHHDVIVVAKDGAIVLDFRFDHTAKGWQEFADKTKNFPALGIAIETCCGAAVERLLEGGYTVYPINPKRAKCYRGRKSTSGVKTDRLDAWSMADALRLDGHTWKALSKEDPLIVELRQVCRDEVAFIEQHTALVNQLQAALREYYPAALEAFDNWTLPSAWAFVETFPSPQILAKAGKRKWQKFFHTHRLYQPEKAAMRIEIFERATAFTGSASTTAAKSLLAVSVAKILRTLNAQMREYRARIEALFEQHPDHDIFGSLPVPGKKVIPRMLAEIGCDRTRFDDAESLQCYAGTAPVAFLSGKKGAERKGSAHIRYACNKHLRVAVHFLADLSRQKCPWADAYYEKKKEEGKHHAAALRCLGQRWLKILWKMWHTRKPYDAELHQRNQVRHGSWVIKLLDETKATATA